ncbi:MAG: prepilin-type N-terminal cleavage/methylation domain-containing protein [Gallionellaceae bacterium]|nr:prepilin-type N-terminal cleavage/methylation domain-containing protein [Gallionellaceae bacterium]
MSASLPSGQGKREAGFTLIELLVVLVIIGVMLGLIGVQLMPDDRSALREEAQRLALLLENAGLEARAGGHSLGWSYDQGSNQSNYRFWIKNEYGDWVPNDDAIFRQRALPSGTYIEAVNVEAQPLQAGEQMLLPAASFPLPFSIRLRNERANASITGSSTGTVSVKLDGGSGS